MARLEQWQYSVDWQFGIAFHWTSWIVLGAAVIWDVRVILTGSWNSGAMWRDEPLKSSSKMMISIYKHKAPNCLYCGSCYSLMGIMLEQQGDWAEALFH